MLQVGNGVLTMEENRSHFTMWCMLAAPLLAGNDIRKMDKETLGILTNKEVIAVNQDKLGKQGGRYMKVGEHEIWVKQLSNGEAAVCFFNRDEQPWNVETVLQKENLSLQMSASGRKNTKYATYGNIRTSEVPRIRCSLIFLHTVSCC